MADKVTIDIPKASSKEVVIIPIGDLGGIKKKFEKIDQILFVIITVLLFSLVAIIVSVVGIFLDQMRYNNAAYKDYAEKIEIVDFGQDANNELLQQNKQNQELILQQQEELLKLFEKQ
ncbi:hypothetical protein HOG17_02940 [Candidatus Peregrinibacteria bacterium]|jgi:hypothetical protein|nr:hypothetical protein [Candidatus Peregrinibacteria bacterium]MBT4148545.1 hypothetical protein [Candidatus Peregrinibacteria bacterium]MBT4456143.1 hypothetical protein [Candidatus Peregrinibacteria bacterium]